MIIPIRQEKSDELCYMRILWNNCSRERILSCLRESHKEVVSSVRRVEKGYIPITRN